MKPPHEGTMPGDHPAADGHRTTIVIDEDIPVACYLAQFEADGSFDFVFTSRRFRELMEISVDEVRKVPASVFDRLHPADRGEFLRRNNEAVRSFDWEGRVIVRGETRWLRIQSRRRETNATGEVWEGALTDITATKSLAERWEAATESGDVGIYDRNYARDTCFYSDGNLRQLGYEPGEWTGSPREWSERLHPDDYERVLAADQAMFDNKTDGVMVEYRLRHKDGSYRWILDRGRIIERDENGRHLRAVGIHIDITERKKAERDLAASHARMTLAGRVAKFGFWHFDVPNNREEWDENLYAMYGHKPDDRSPRWENFLHPEDREVATRELGAAMAKGGDYEIAFRILRPDGAVRFIRECGFVVHDENGRAISATGADIDITEEKEAAERDRKLAAEHRRELESKLKTSLNAAAVAHEINQPLSAILLDSQMALDRIQGDSRELHQARAFLSSTISNAERTADTIGKMMSLLRAVQTAHHEVNLVDVVRSAELYAKDALCEGGIAWRTEGTARAVKIKGDEGQLLLAVSNLLRNAIESIKADDRQRPRQILVSLRKDNGSIVLAIGDSGAGLPEKTLAKIPLHTTKPDGTGLGLFIVKSAAENHGAILEAGPSKLGGAELRLVFPAAK